jgi:hypothetical protein
MQSPRWSVRRRRWLTHAAGIAGAALAAPSRGAPAVLAWRPLAAPGPVVQIAAGGPSGLLAVSADGSLLALPVAGGPAQRLADGIDGAVPLATGHGRIAARRADGALWVHEAGRATASPQRDLAEHAGLLILPLAVIAIERDASRRRAARFEPAGGLWRAVARSDIDLLPDARPLQAELEGGGDGGHVVLLAGPDGQRYRHGVLGDAIEATRLVVLERHSLALLRELVLEPPHVFEDIAPRRVSLGAHDGLLTVRAGPQGAQLVLIDADPARPAALRIAASGLPLGTANRWLSPIVAGARWLAVHTPHIGGVLHEYQRAGDRLLARVLDDGVSNHRLGSRTLDQSATRGSRLWLPTRSGRGLRVLDLQPAQQVAALGTQQHELPGRIEAVLALPPAGPVVVLLEEGTVLAADGA